MPGPVKRNRQRILLTAAELEGMSAPRKYLDKILRDSAWKPFHSFLRKWEMIKAFSKCDQRYSDWLEPVETIPVAPDDESRIWELVCEYFQHLVDEERASVALFPNFPRSGFSNPFCQWQCLERDSKYLKKCEEIYGTFLERRREAVAMVEVERLGQNSGLNAIAVEEGLMDIILSCM